MLDSDSKTFDSTEQQQAYECLLKELRCVTCPNQSISDSSQPVARAMQDEIFLRLKQNDSIEAIRQDLLASYGDYVSYNPVMKVETYGLWFGPLIMLVIGLGTWFLFFKRAKKSL